MRDFLNAILIFIGSTSLTNDEFEDFSGLSYGYNLDTFNKLKMLLIERDEVTESTERLQSYFQAKGLSFDVDPGEIAVSNIFIGAAL